MAAPQSIVDLVAKFDAHHAEYQRGNYNETMARRDFIDPLFEALGWDMQNKASLSEKDRTVIHEDSIRIGDATKAPDYCMRVGGRRQFFVEAKRPSVDLKAGSDPAFQVRRYAWSAKLPLSILTDFEEFVVYDCRLRPKEGDASKKARMHYYTFDQYVERWDEIHALFSYEAVSAGSLEPYVLRQARGTEQVDDAFLEDIEHWRESLAKNIANRNRDLSQEELNFAVQATIDRLVFLRIAEDRGIEPYSMLLGMTNGAGIYGRIKQLFRKADERYNSGLFHFSDEADVSEPPDAITPRIEIDDDVLRGIIRGLYPPESPYAFSVISADILGQVYEQFLGKVIHLTSDHRAKIEEKPEVRKAGGVFYTPTYIVEYIVHHTLGKVLEGKTPKQVESVKVCDPACGSGSFLLGAYQYLLDWHLQYYLSHPEKTKQELYQTTAGDVRLTTAVRKKILLNSIFGVDLDAQAVEVTKLSLLMKVLEGETEETLGKQMSFLTERVLPDLGRNIRCGNSLVGSEYLLGEQRNLLDLSGDVQTVRPFDWAQSFAEVFERKDPGFDVIVGNPPYIFGEWHDAASKAFIQTSYATARAQFDTYWLFIEKGMALARKQGYCALIVPDALLARDEPAPVRSLLLENGLQSLYHCGLVFKDAAVSAVVFILQKGSKNPSIASYVRDKFKAVAENLCKTERFMNDSAKRLLIHASDEEHEVMMKLLQGHPSMKTILSISRGEETGKKNVGDVGPIPILVGGDIAPFELSDPTLFVKAIEKDPSLYAGPKIVITKTGATCIAAIDTQGVVTMQSVYNVHVTNRDYPLEVVVALLNSAVTQFLIKKRVTAYKLLFPQLNQGTIEELPLPAVQSELFATIVSLVTRRMQFHTPGSSTPHQLQQYEQHVMMLERQIDAAIFSLYGLNTSDVAIIVGTARETAVLSVNN